MQGIGYLPHLTWISQLIVRKRWVNFVYLLVGWSSYLYRAFSSLSAIWILTWRHSRLWASITTPVLAALLNWFHSWVTTSLFSLGYAVLSLSRASLLIATSYITDPSLHIHWVIHIVLTKFENSWTYCKSQGGTLSYLLKVVIWTFTPSKSFLVDGGKSQVILGLGSAKASLRVRFKEEWGLSCWKLLTPPNLTAFWPQPSSSLLEPSIIAIILIVHVFLHAHVMLFIH